MGFILWNAAKSVKLSLAAVYIFTAFLLVILCAAPFFLAPFLNLSGRPMTLETLILIELYACAVPAAIALFSLAKLLWNLNKDEIFIHQNSKMLRILSWCCFAVGIFTFIGGFGYMPFFIVSAAAIFFALILRVLKNVFHSAIILREDNEMTI